MITGNENLLQISEISADLIPVFEKHGLGNYFRPENLKKIGKYTKLSTLLKSKKIEQIQFIAELNKTISYNGDFNPARILDKDQDLHFISMLPCGLRNPFKEYFESNLFENQSHVNDFNYIIEGNVNHELSYYPLLDSIKEISELPDIIMSSDINNFFHRPFIENFINKGYFGSFTPFEANHYLEDVGFSDPAGNYTMFTANMLVMVIDKGKLNGRKMPEKWDDLLTPEFTNDIIMRGEDNFFCNAVLLPFFKDHGFDAIRILAKNIKAGLHPSEMVKLIGKDTKETATVYVMPYFFAKRIKDKNAEIIWPTDGAIASPVFLLIKKDKLKTHESLLNFIFGKDTGVMLKGRYFPSTHPMVTHETFPGKPKWLGWDFLNGYDIGKLKADIRTEFLKIWNNKNY